jgi:hypothetical protein
MGEVEYQIGDTNHLTVKATYTVEMHDRLSLRQTDNRKPIEIDVKIVADFEKIPVEYHNTFIQMMSARYGGTVNCYSNTEPFAIIEKKKRKWYQLFK